MRIGFQIAGLAAAGLCAAAPLAAELPVGAQAPGFTTQAAMAGEEMGFSLRAALSKGPVVLYFYPKAFTQGCTLEANASKSMSAQIAVDCLMKESLKTAGVVSYFWRNRSKMAIN